MRIEYEFRINEEFAHLLFDPTEGKRLGNSIREVILTHKDSRLTEIGRLQAKLRKSEGRPFFYGWNIHYRYSPDELNNAELLFVNSTAGLEQAGEEYGTLYDEANVCPLCGEGRNQVSYLILDLKDVPKGNDIATTLANERIVSQRLAELIVDNSITGVDLRPVIHKTRLEDEPIEFRELPSGREILRRAEAAGISYSTWQFYVWLNRPEQTLLLDSVVDEHVNRHKTKVDRRTMSIPKWYQLVVVSRSVSIAVPPTRFGINPFDEDPEGRYKCPLGHVLGLNLLSEPYILRESWDGSDVALTKEKIGVHRGLLRPEPLLVISKRFWKILRENKIRGYSVGVVNIKNNR